MESLAGECTELLQQLIRNRCVNDGTVASGNEVRSVDTLVSYMEGAGLDIQRYESQPGRGSMVARIEGSDPTAPSLCLMGHLDVVPVNEANWERDPFGGELVGDMVWGRGAVDMLDTTSSMAVAFKHLASSGFEPRGDLVFFGVADEEALGLHGAKWMCDTNPDDIRTTYLLTEFGGMKMPLDTGGGPKLVVMVGEKGTFWSKIRVRGTAGHASRGSFRTDNALVKAAEVAKRLAAYRPPASMHEPWRRFIGSLGLDESLQAMLLDPVAFEKLCEELPVGLAQTLYACTHTTIVPTIMHAGIKTNVIPDTAEIQVDIRTLPGETADDTRAMLQDAIGDRWDQVEIAEDNPFEASDSPMDTPLWDSVTRVTKALVPGSQTVPFIIVGATDARYFRQTLGTTSYGYGLLSERIPYNDFIQLFHGDNECVDVESLRLMTELWEAVAKDLLA
ncbi:MAG: M20/M25/M40 family metallo-hydrolase [Actinomycetota bacterium]